MVNVLHVGKYQDLFNKPLTIKSGDILIVS